MGDSFGSSLLMVVNYINNVMQMTEQIGDELVTLGNQTVLRAADQVDSGVKILADPGQDTFADLRCCPSQ